MTESPITIMPDAQFREMLVPFLLNANVLCYLWLALILAVIGILFLTRRQGWIGFSQRHKWRSRATLCALALFVAVPLAGASGIIYDFVPGKIAMESPNLTGTAIKLGLYSWYSQQQVTNQLPPEKKNLPACVIAISSAEAKKYQDKCGDDVECFTHIPPMSRSELIDTIKKIQAAQLEGMTKSVTDACQQVDSTKL